MGSYAPVHEEQLVENLRLLQAVKENAISQATEALETAEVDFADLQAPLNLQTPLRCACAEANVKMARLLLSHSADVFAHFAADGWTALHSACHGGHNHMAQLLLQEVPSLHETTFHEGWGLLHLLVLAVTERLPNRGGDLVAWVFKKMPALEVNCAAQRPGYLFWTPLHLAASRGLNAVISALLKAQADPHAMTGEFHVSSLQMNRLAGGDESAVTCMGGLEAEPEDLDRGLLPLHLAAFGGHLRAAQLLLRAADTVNATTQSHCWTPLMYGVWSNEVALVREVLRVGGRAAVNWLDRRPDGTQWCPLALAVVHGSEDMVEALVEYKADLLVRLNSADFPGGALVRHCSLALPDAAKNAWSGPDGRIGLLHLALCRGDVSMLRRLLPLLRQAHQQPVHAAKGEPLAHEPLTLREPQAGASKAKAQRKARQRLTSAPAREAQSCDPMTFCTDRGWCCAILALFLHTVDPQRSVRCFPLTAAFDAAGPAPRAELFLALGVEAVARAAEAQATVPQRLPEVAETLVNMAINEFVRLCQVLGAEKAVWERVLQATLCLACHWDRLKVVRHLLDVHRCDPCVGLSTVERKPLHVAASCGHGDLAQMLLDFKADALEEDENRQRPVVKLTRAMEGKMRGLQARVAQLEALLDDGTASPGSSLGTRTLVPSQTPPRAGKRPGGGPKLMARYDALLHDSRM